MAGGGGIAALILEDDDDAAAGAARRDHEAAVKRKRRKGTRGEHTQRGRGRGLQMNAACAVLLGVESANVAAAFGAQTVQTDRVQGSRGFTMDLGAPRTFAMRRELFMRRHVGAPCKVRTWSNAPGLFVLVNALR